MNFYSTFFLALHGITRVCPESPPTRPILRAPARLPPLFPGPAANSRHSGPGNAKNPRLKSSNGDSGEGCQRTGKP